MAPSPASLRLSASALVLLLLTGCGGSAVSSDTTSSSDAASSETSAAPELRGERAVVERVIDGDTVDVQRNGEVVRVRLLNIDTPETKDPNEIVECLGPEATALLEELLPPGTVVGLEYDQERTDRYDGPARRGHVVVPSGQLCIGPGPGRGRGASPSPDTRVPEPHESVGVSPRMRRMPASARSAARPSPCSSRAGVTNAASASSGGLSQPVVMQ